MGTIIHEAVLVVTDSDSAPDISAFRDSLPEEFRPLVIGPVALGASASYAFLPDGGKEGKDTSRASDGHRERFLELFASAHDGDVVSVRFGSDLYEEGSTPSAKYPTT